MRILAMDVEAVKFYALQPLPSNNYYHSDLTQRRLKNFSVNWFNWIIQKKHHYCQVKGINNVYCFSLLLLLLFTQRQLKG